MSGVEECERIIALHAEHFKGADADSVEHARKFADAMIAQRVRTRRTVEQPLQVWEECSKLILEMCRPDYAGQDVKLNEEIFGIHYDDAEMADLPLPGDCLCGPNCDGDGHDHGAPIPLAYPEEELFPINEGPVSAGTPSSASVSSDDSNQCLPCANEERPTKRRRVSERIRRAVSRRG